MAKRTRKSIDGGGGTPKQASERPQRATGGGAAHPVGDRPSDSVKAAVESMMRPAISFISLPVANVERSRRFYESLGLRASDRSLPECAFFQLNGVILGVTTRAALAKALGFPVGRGSGVLLSHNVRDADAVGGILRRAKRAGAEIVRPAGSTEWGWEMGCFRDPDGHLWEVVFNPRLAMDPVGNVLLDPPEVW